MVDGGEYNGKLISHMTILRFKGRHNCGGIVT